jgi:uncharacterized protein YcnI
MKKSLVFVVATAVVVMTAAPAWAHEEITPSTVQTGKPSFFTLSAANEKDVGLTEVTLRAPNGTPFGAATHQPAGWTAERSEDTIKWSGGSVPAGAFESWGFEIEGADQPGPLTFRVTLVFANGSNENVNVVVTALAAGTTPSQTTVTTGGAGTTAVTTATSEPAPGTTAPQQAARADKDSDSNGLAVAALVVGGLALLLAGVALAQARRGRTAAAASAPADEGKKDW